MIEFSPQVNFKSTSSPDMRKASQSGEFLFKPSGPSEQGHSDAGTLKVPFGKFFESYNNSEQITREQMLDSDVVSVPVPLMPMKAPPHLNNLHDLKPSSFEEPPEATSSVAYESERASGSTAFYHGYNQEHASEWLKSDTAVDPHSSAQTPPHYYGTAEATMPSYSALVSYDHTHIISP